MRWRVLLVTIALLAAQTVGSASGAGVTRRPVQRAAAPTRVRPLPQPGPVAELLMDVRTGRVLHGRDIHRPWSPASTTKMLTAVLALERFPEDEVVTVSPRAAAARSGAAIGLEAGEQWLIGDLVRAMLVHSANDAAVAVAEAVAGSVEKFADLMNAKARQIGARESHFVNPNGLHDPAHYSTAYDLALIARYALQNPLFASMVRTPTWEVSRPDRAAQVYVNTNKLLRRYPGADGVKTGWTVASGHILVASATRDGWQLLSVVLRDQNMYRDAEDLLEYGFKNFTPVLVAERGDAMAVVPIGRLSARVAAVVPADVVAVVRRGASVLPRVTLRSDLRLPIQPGTPVGEVRFVEGASIVAASILVAARPTGR